MDIKILNIDELDPCVIIKTSSKGKVLDYSHSAEEILTFFKVKKEEALPNCFSSAIKKSYADLKTYKILIQTDKKSFLFAIVPEKKCKLMTIYGIDVSELKKAQENMRNAALSDSLTKLMNRRAFFARFDKEINLAKKNNLKFIVMILDIDYFKQINDCLGHDVGDRLLFNVSEWLNRAIQKEDCLARIGGDEFAIIFKNIAQPDSLNGILDKLLSMKKEVFNLANHDFSISLTIGYSIFPDNGKTKKELLKKADIALLTAKNEKRGTSRGYSDIKNDEENVCYRFMDLEREGLDFSRLNLRYLPILNVVDKGFFGLYAVLYYDDPSFLCTNQKLFKLIYSQESKLNVDNFILEGIKKDFKSIQLPEHVRLIIPASDGMMLNVFYVEKVRDLMKKLGLLNSQVFIELPENLFSVAREAIVESLENERIQVCVKSEQVGLFSIKSLCERPVTMISFDENIVANLKKQENHAAEILDLYIKIASSMDLITLVHGVSNEEHLRILLLAGCKLMDGNVSGNSLDKNSLKQYLQHLKLE